MEKQKIMNDRELAFALDPSRKTITPWTVRHWRIAGGMPFFQVGRRIFYRLESVLAWLDKQEQDMQNDSIQDGIIRPVK